MCTVTVPLNHGVGALTIPMSYGAGFCTVTVPVTHGVGALTIPMSYGAGFCTITVPLNQVSISRHSVT